MPRRPAVLAGRAAHLLLPVVHLAILGCRSAVVPPPSDGGAAQVDWPLSPALGAKSPRHECPAPVDVMARLEERVQARLEEEKRAAQEGLALLRAQRDAFVGALRSVAGDRAAASAARRAALAAGIEPAGALRELAALAEDEAIGALLGRTADWCSAEAPAEGRPARRGRRPPAAPGLALAGTAPADGKMSHREGRWILPVIRTLARLRIAFDDVASILADAAVLAETLRRAESLLRGESDRARNCADTGHDAAAEDPLAKRLRRGASIGVLVPADVAAVVRAARREACARAVDDLAGALRALDAGRPAACRTAEGSAVCLPPAVDEWVASEIDGIDASEPGQAERLERLLDDFLGPSGITGGLPHGKGANGSAASARGGPGGGEARSAEQPPGKMETAR